jgi:hypothetical protein
MIIYLQHPQHGQKVATSDMEAEYDETNGWVRYNPDTFVETAFEVKKLKRNNICKVIDSSVEQINKSSNFLISVSNKSKKGMK